MAVDRAKLNKYAKLLYEGMRERHKNKIKSTGARIAPSSTQGMKIVNDYQRCDICGLKYDGPVSFEIHHIDGDRSNTVTRNLVLLCKICHSKVTTEAKAKLKDYKIESKKSGGATSARTKTKTKTKKPRRRKDPLDINFTPPSFKPPSFRPPSFRW